MFHVFPVVRGERTCQSIARIMNTACTSSFTMKGMYEDTATACSVHTNPIATDQYHQNTIMTSTAHISCTHLGDITVGMFLEELLKLLQRGMSQCNKPTRNMSHLTMDTTQLTSSCLPLYFISNSEFKCCDSTNLHNKHVCHDCTQ